MIGRFFPSPCITVNAVFSRRRIRYRAGFTLIEILVALFIFSIIVVTIFGSYRFVFSHHDAIRDATRMEEMAQNGLQRMMRDLQAIQVTARETYSKPESESSADPFRFTADIVSVGAETFPRVRFVSLEHVDAGPNPEEGIAEIVYYVMAEDQGGTEYRYVLRRSDRLDYREPIEENPMDPILCESLTSLRIRYVDDEGEAHERWDSDSDDYDYATPRAVEIEFEMGAGSMTRRFKTAVFLPVSRKGAANAP